MFWKNNKMKIPKLINRRPKIQKTQLAAKDSAQVVNKPLYQSLPANKQISKPQDRPPDSEGKPQITNPNADIFTKNLNLIDIISPNSVETDFDYIKINNTYFRTIFVAGYPRFVGPGWLESVINFNSSLDTAFYIYPVEGKSVLDDLRRKITEMEAELATDLERGKIVDPTTQAKLEDALALQEQLVKGSERFFEFAFYITIPAATLE
jgi:hypothetical protein